MEETHCSTKHPQILLSDHAFQNDTSHYHSHASNIPVYFPSVIKSIIFVFGILYVYIFTILTKSPSWSSLLPIVLRTRRGAMRSGPTSQHPLKIHGGGQVNTANLMFSSRELATTINRLKDLPTRWTHHLRKAPTPTHKEKNDRQFPRPQLLVHAVYY